MKNDSRIKLEKLAGKAVKVEVYGFFKESSDELSLFTDVFVIHVNGLNNTKREYYFDHMWLPICFNPCTNSWDYDEYDEYSGRENIFIVHQYTRSNGTKSYGVREPTYDDLLACKELKQRLIDNEHGVKNNTYEFVEDDDIYLFEDTYEPVEPELIIFK